MSEQQATESKPTEAPAAGAAPAAGSEEGPSKSALKKAAAAAKKAEAKAKKAAEVAMREAQAKAAAGGGEDLAKDNYGGAAPAERLTSPEITLPELGEAQVDKTVHLFAFMQNSRMQGAKMAFVELREKGTWAIQGIVAASAEGKPVSKQMVKWVGSLSVEAWVLVEGVVKKAPEPVKSVRVSGYELHISRFYCISPGPQQLGLTLAAANNGFSNEDAAPEEGPVVTASLNTHLDYFVISKRSAVRSAVADVRETTKELFRSYLKERGFHEFESPCIIEAASEGGANVFSADYFDKKVYLAQSPQFYKQYEIAGGRQRVFCIGPVFRAENSNTPRHMTEFTGLDMEMVIKWHYHEVRDMLEGVFLYIFRELKKQCAEQIETVRSVFPAEDFALPEPGKEVRLTFAEGQKLLREEGPEEFRNVSDFEDMSTPQEKALGEIIRKKFGTDFYVLDKFPESARPFYTCEDPENSELTNAYDFFMRGQEIMSGGQRIHKPEEIEARMRRKGLDPNSKGLKGYVNTFRQAGVPPHGGGGIGLDRVVQFFLNLSNVQYAAFYPRTPNRVRDGVSEDEPAPAPAAES
ncbi:hypothetical protein MCOR25_002598 [Pyricularia grisea]|nr:hypothetical protein MCOR25_002598 [Pyricularia grisea]